MTGVSVLPRRKNIALATKVVFLLTILLWSDLCVCSEIDLTVEIPPGRQECFWQTIPQTVPVEVDYQVIDGGDMDIDLFISSPDNRIMHADRRKSDNVVKYKSTVAGDYRFCFDNTFSRISTKVVYFEIFVDSPDDDSAEDSNLTFEGEDLQDMLDMTVEDFKGILERAKRNLDRSIQVQTLIRIHEAKDRNTQEANYQRVNFLSCFNLVVMITVGVVQVIMIRNLFNQKSAVSGSTLRQKT